MKTVAKVASALTLGALFAFGAQSGICAGNESPSKMLEKTAWHNGNTFYIFGTEDAEHNISAEGGSFHEGGFKLNLKYLGDGRYRQIEQYTETENATVTVEQVPVSETVSYSYIAFRNAGGEMIDALLPLGSKADPESPSGFAAQGYAEVADYISGSYIREADNALLVIRPNGTGVDLTMDGETVFSQLHEGMFEEIIPAFDYNGKHYLAEVTENGIIFREFSGASEELDYEQIRKQPGIRYRSNDNTEPRFAYLSSSLYSPGFFLQFSPEVLKLIRNELYARHGHVFQNRKLIEYFNSRDWYGVALSTNRPETPLTPVESFNVKMIQIAERHLKD